MAVRNTSQQQAGQGQQSSWQSCRVHLNWGPADDDADTCPDLLEVLHQLHLWVLHLVALCSCIKPHKSAHRGGGGGREGEVLGTGLERLVMERICGCGERWSSGSVDIQS